MTLPFLKMHAQALLAPSTEGDPALRVIACRWSSRPGAAHAKLEWCCVCYQTVTAGRYKRRHAHRVGTAVPPSMIRSQVIESFVARIWLEHAEGQDPKWRGHVQHIQGSEEIYFQNLAEVSEFLERVSGVQGPALARGQAVDEQACGRSLATNARTKKEK